jgi:hypothetical protein
MSPGLVKLFNDLGLHAIHHNTLFSPLTLDPEIIEYVAKNDFVLITYDRRITRVHRVALREHNPSVVFLSASIQGLKIDSQEEWYKTTWVKVCTRLSGLAPKTQISVRIGGDFRIVWQPGQIEDEQEQSE